MFKMLQLNKKEVPENLNKFDIPILIRKNNKYYYATGHKSEYVSFDPAHTDGFYYTNNVDEKFYRVREGEKVYYLTEPTIVFLTEDASKR